MKINLLWPITCESIIIGIKSKLKYKSFYLFNYVWLKIVMKALHGLCDSPLYKEAKRY
jgi:hypothetical protein